MTVCSLLFTDVVDSALQIEQLGDARERSCGPSTVAGRATC